MPDITPLPAAATDPNANLDRGNARYGYGSALPLPVYFVLVTVLWWGLGVLLLLLTHPARVDGPYLLIRAAGALVFGGVMTALVGYRQRRSGGREAVRAMHRAVRSGELPAGANRATWEPALDWRERQTRRSRWLVPVVFGLFALPGVWLLVVDPHAVVLGAVTVAAFVALIVWQEVLAARQLPHIRRLKQQLGASA